jgi:uncharacterized protein YkwD
MNKLDINLDLLINLHNQARENRAWFKKPAILTKHDKLMLYAQNHANWMMNKKSLIHSNIGGLMDLGFSNVAENIAWGQSTEQRVMDSWLLSRGHRANIMGFSYNLIGCGVSISDENKPYWCVVFGKE